MKSNDELMNMYGEYKTVMGRSVRKLLKHVSTRFVRMAMSISRSISMW